MNLRMAGAHTGMVRPAGLEPVASFVGAKGLVRMLNCVPGKAIDGPKRPLRGRLGASTNVQLWA